jgi:hypothetical protein
MLSGAEGLTTTERATIVLAALQYAIGQGRRSPTAELAKLADRYGQDAADAALECLATNERGMG